MERSVVVGLPGWLGRRVVVRHLLPDGRATDVLGTLVAVDGQTLTVRRDRVDDSEPGPGHEQGPGGRAGPDVEVALADVVLAKPVPPPPARRGPRRG